MPFHDDFILRTAEHGDIDRLNAHIRKSGIELSQGFYSHEQAQALTEHVFGVDTALIDDRTYYLVEAGDRIAACGGWSRRNTLYGGDQAKSGEDPLLDPATQAARIRAFFVSPDFARRGLGMKLIAACQEAALKAGFSTMELGSTMPGVPLYRAAGFEIVEEFEITLPGNIKAPLARMSKRLVL